MMKMRPFHYFFTGVAFFLHGLCFAQVPVNDDCNNAIIVDDFPYTESVDATEATNNEGSIEIGSCSSMNDGIWYEVIGTGKEITIDLKTSSFDSKIGVYTGSCESLECVLTVDDSFTFSGEKAIFNSILGLSYFINVGYWDVVDGPEGPLDISFFTDTTEVDICGHFQRNNDTAGGILIGVNDAKVAGDFIVTANTPDFTTNRVVIYTASIGEVATVSLQFYEDADEAPGKVYGPAMNNLTPSEVEEIGSSEDLTIRKITIDLEEDLNFKSSTGKNVRYWMQVVASTNIENDLIYWETTNSNAIGQELAVQTTAGSDTTWISGIEEVVFELEGTCSIIEDCFSVIGTESVVIDRNTVRITWNSQATPDQGYLVEIYLADQDTASNQPVQTIKTDPLMNFVVVEDLDPNVNYDAYITSICEDGHSAPIQLSFSTGMIPNNDNLCNATRLTLDQSCFFSSFNNFNATIEEGEPEGLCFDEGPKKTVWFYFILDENQPVKITTDLPPATLNDTEVAIYKAPEDCQLPITLGEAIACDQDSGNEISFNSIITTEELEANVEYYIQVSGYADIEGTFCIEVQTVKDCASPSKIDLVEITNNFARFQWVRDTDAKAGYEMEIYRSSDDPLVDAPLFTEQIDLSLDTISVFNLEAGQQFLAQLRANCDEKGISEPLELIFSTPPQIPACGELFFDSGGEDRTYQNNEEYSILISPEIPGEPVIIEFIDVDIEEGFDFLRVFDGDETDDPELSALEDGVLEPATFSATNPEGQLLVTFKSDPLNIGEGWTANVMCTSSSIEILQDEPLQVFPNPSSETLHLTNEYSDCEVEILDLFGNSVFKDFIHAKQKKAIDVAQWQKGTYVIIHKRKEIMGVQKFAKI